MFSFRIKITLKNAAMWTDSRYLAQADAELDCEWHIFDIGQNVGIADWLDVSGLHKTL